MHLQNIWCMLQIHVHFDQLMRFDRCRDIHMHAGPVPDQQVMLLADCFGHVVANDVHCKYYALFYNAAIWHSGMQLRRQPHWPHHCGTLMLCLTSIQQ